MDEFIITKILKENVQLATFFALVIILFFTFCLIYFLVDYVRRSYFEKRIPKLANIKKGDSYDLYIGRANKWLDLPASKWGNPFLMKNESERAKVILEYENHILNNPELIKSLPELAGKTLGCYCFNTDRNEGKTCHGLILIKLYKEFVVNKK